MLLERKLFFLLNVSNLLKWAFENGFQPDEDESSTLEERKRIFISKFVSKIIRSKREKLKFELNLYIDGALVTTEEEYKPLSDYWKSLNHRNYSGKECGKKPNYFEMLY